ncbi:MAG: pentapeptide repeat-containing protein [Prochlorotrichaceae cyanobacterium]
MANPLHLAQLQQGVAAWNVWRVEHPQCRPDLRGAYLQNKDLSRINLSDADLRFAFLFKTNFRSANLRGAVLIGADLIQAQLQGADLRDAVLTGTYLTHADLEQANLQGADLRGAMLRGAHLDSALLPSGEGIPQQRQKLKLPETLSLDDATHWETFTPSRSSQPRLRDQTSPQRVRTPLPVAPMPLRPRPTAPQPLQNFT